jgi:hypothetical protein
MNGAQLAVGEGSGIVKLTVEVTERIEDGRGAHGRRDGEGGDAALYEHGVVGWKKLSAETIDNDVHGRVSGEGE